MPRLRGLSTFQLLGPKVSQYLTLSKFQVRDDINTRSSGDPILYPPNPFHVALFHQSLCFPLSLPTTTEYRDP